MDTQYSASNPAPWKVVRDHLDQNGATNDEVEASRQLYFDRVVAPRYTEDELPEAKALYDERTGFSPAWRSTTQTAKTIGSAALDAGGKVGELIDVAADKARPVIEDIPGAARGLVDKARKTASGIAPDYAYRAGIEPKPTQIDELLAAAEDKYHLPMGLLDRMAQVESGKNIHTKDSSAGAKGIMQFMPATAKGLGIDPYNPAQAIDGAGRMMRRLIDKYDGNLENAVAAYNAGEDSVGKHGGIPPFAETKAYVSKVLGSAMDRADKHVKGLPVTAQARDQVKAQLEAATPEGRKSLLAREDWIGREARSLAGIMDESLPLAREAEKYDSNATGTREGRTNLYLNEGLSPEQARTSAATDARRVAPDIQQAPVTGEAMSAAPESPFRQEMPKGAFTPVAERMPEKNRPEFPLDVGPEPTVGNIAKGIIGSVPNQFAQMKVASQLALHDVLGRNTPESNAQRANLMRQMEQLQVRRENQTPEFKTATGEGLYGGGVSLAQNSVGLFASIMTGNPAPALSMMGLQTSLPAYGKYRTRGGQPGESAVGGLSEGALEAGTELMPMGFMVKTFGKAGMGQFISGLLGREMASEQVATITQDAVDTAIANPNKTWSQFWAERPKAAYQTALGVLVQAGAMGGLHAGASALAGKQATPATTFDNQGAANQTPQQIGVGLVNGAINNANYIPAPTQDPIQAIGNATSVDEAIQAAASAVGYVGAMPEIPSDAVSIPPSVVPTVGESPKGIGGIPTGNPIPQFLTGRGSDGTGAGGTVGVAEGGDTGQEVADRESGHPLETIDEAAHQAATSPNNYLPEPTEAEKKAGNYQLGHVNVGGLDISVENPAGSERKGTDANGQPWSVTMADHYGYVRGTVGKDKDHVAVFIKQGTSADYQGPVFVIDQENDKGGFEEHKAMIGYASQKEAWDAYHANYSKGWNRAGGFSTFGSMDAFKQWVFDKDKTDQRSDQSTPKQSYYDQFNASETFQPAATQATPAASDTNLSTPTHGIPAATPPDAVAAEAGTEAENGGETPAVGKGQKKSKLSENETFYNSAPEGLLKLWTTEAGYQHSDVFNADGTRKNWKALPKGLPRKLAKAFEPHIASAKLAENDSGTSHLENEAGGAPSQTEEKIGDEELVEYLKNSKNFVNAILNHHLDDVEFLKNKYPDILVQELSDYIDNKGDFYALANPSINKRLENIARKFIEDAVTKLGKAIEKQMEIMGKDEKVISWSKQESNTTKAYLVAFGDRWDKLLGGEMAKAYEDGSLKKDIDVYSLISNYKNSNLDDFNARAVALRDEIRQRKYPDASTQDETRTTGYATKPPPFLASKIVSDNTRPGVGTRQAIEQATGVGASTGIGEKDLRKVGDWEKPEWKNNLPFGKRELFENAIATVKAAWGKPWFNEHFTWSAPSFTEKLDRAKQRLRRQIESEAFDAMVADASAASDIESIKQAAAQWMAGQKADTKDDPARLDMLGWFLDGNKLTMPAEFFDSVQKEIRKRAKAAQLEKNRDPSVNDKALISAWGKLEAEGELAIADFEAGWNHYLGGKTVSTLPPGKKIMVEGWKSAQQWTKTEEGKAWYEGKPRNKLENTGAELRRWFDKAKKDLENASKDDVDAVLATIEAATTRAEFFRNLAAPNATPGTLRYIEDVRDAIVPFKEWAADDLRLKAWRVSSPTELLLGYMRGDINSYGRGSNNTDDKGERIAKVNALAGQYIDTLNLIAETLQGAENMGGALTGFSLRMLTPDSIDKMLGMIVDGKSWQWSTYRDQKLSQDGEFAEKVFRNGISRLLMIYQQEAFKTENEASTDTKKKPLTPPRLESVFRTGEDWRKGKDVTPQAFKEKFGFADVGFGKWVNTKADQEHLNHAYDALMDFAELMKVHPQLIGLGGKLHFTIGALGHGKFAAHFSPNQPHPDGGTVPVINLTNTKGDGTVAHEWLHALDELGAEAQDAIKMLKQALTRRYDYDQVYKAVIHQLKNGGTFQRDGRKIKGWDALDHARYAIDYYGKQRQSSHFYENAKALDKGSSKPYWSNDKEPFARAGEAAVMDLREADQKTNNYLVNPDWVGDGKIKNPQYRGAPYPMDEERKEFAKWYKALFNAMSVKDGRLTFNKERFEQDRPHTHEEFDKALAELRARIPAIYEQMQDAKRAKQLAADMAKTEEARKERERVEAERKEAERLAEENRMKEELEKQQAQPEPLPSGVLSADDISRAFDLALAELAEENAERPEVPPPGETTATTIKQPPKNPKAEQSTETTQHPSWFSIGPLGVNDLKRSLEIPAKKKWIDMTADEQQRMEDLARERYPSKFEKHPQQQESPAVAQSIKHAADLGVKGLDETLKGLHELFGGNSLRSFPGGIDEETYAKAKPHFEKALANFQEAGKTIVDLFKFLIQEFGAGIRPYAERFAMEQKLSANLSEQNKTSASQQIAEWVAEELFNGREISWQQLFRKADEAYGGTQGEGKYTVKDAYDSLEAGVNRRILRQKTFDPGDTNYEIRVGKNPVGVGKDVIHQLNGMLKKIPTQTKRTEEQEEFQQFSTPPTLAYATNWVANIKSGETMMEPSAGIGGLAVFAKLAGANVVVNELSQRRAAILREVLPDARVFTENAEQLNNLLPEDVRPTVIVMNPPFSSTAGRVKGSRDTMNGARHIEQALKRLAPGGRLVAIVGEGMADDKPAFRKWWSGIKSQYAVRANVGISGDEYRKYGTTFDNQILVIDKVTPVDGASIITEKVAKIADLLPKLEEIRNDRRQPAIQPQPPVSQPGSGQVSNGDREGQTQTSRPDTGPVGAEEQDIPVSTDSLPVPNGGRSGQDGRANGNDGAGKGSNNSGRKGGSGKSGGRTGQGGGGVPDSGQPDVENGGKSTAGQPELEIESGEKELKTGEITNSVYESYQPAFLRIPGSKEHPGKLVESAAMAAVDPPKPTYTPNLPKETITSGKLSLPQLEAIVYAGQAFGKTNPDGTRKGFLIGDGTGVGKGREIAGVILDAMRSGHGNGKAVWVSVNSGLYADSKEYYEQVGGDPAKFHKQPSSYEPIKHKDGILFVSYDWLRGESIPKNAENNDPFYKQGETLTISRNGFRTKTFRVIEQMKPNAKKVEVQNVDTLAVEEIGIDKFDQYAAIKSQRDSGKKTRIDLLMDWLGADFDGVIAFDEAHKMGNADNSVADGKKKNASKTAIAGLKLQNELKDARILYASATAATEVRNLLFAPRLGMWGERTAFSTAQDFVNKIAGAGVSAMELVAQGMKAAGSYIARSLSFEGVTQATMEHELTAEQTDVYNGLAQTWQEIYRQMRAAAIETGQSDKGRFGGESQFWGTQQRFFNAVITSMQMPTVLAQAEQDLKDGKAVIFQLTNTGEAQQDREVSRGKAEGLDIEELDFSPKQSLINMVRDMYPVQEYEEQDDGNGGVKMAQVLDSEGNPVLNREMVEAREELIKNIESIRCVDNPLDMIIDRFGYDNVAEVTGRGKRFVWDRAKDGTMERKEQNLSKNTRERDQNEFMDDKRHVLVFSSAGGTGFSFHADNTRKNKRKRVHYPIQPGWQASVAIQGLGRSHRTNEASQPHYWLTTTNLKAQKRFVSSIARRLDQLGALTRGQRQTGSQGMFKPEDNLENKYATGGVQLFFKDLFANSIPGLSFDDIAVAKMGFNNLVNQETKALIENNIPKTTQFLNRMLSLEVHDQNTVFTEFFDRITELVQRDIEQGKYDEGIKTLRADKITKEQDEIIYTDEETGASARFLELELTYPMKFNSFEAVQAMAEQAGERFAGYYRDEKTGKAFALLKRGTMTTKEGNVVSRGTMIPVSYKKDKWRSVENADRIFTPGLAMLKKEVEAEQYEGPYLTENVENSLSQINSSSFGAMFNASDRKTIEDKINGASPYAEAQKRLWERMQPYIVTRKVSRNVPQFTKLTEAQAMKAWDDEAETAPKTFTERVNMVSGVILPIWDRIPGDPHVVRTQTDDGERIIGREISGRDLPGLRLNFAIASNVTRMSKEDQYAKVRGGMTAILANGWRLERNRASGENRVEIVSPSLTAGDQRMIQTMGAFSEKIGWTTRWFIPSLDVFTRLTESKPVVEFVGEASGGEHQSLGSLGVGGVLLAPNGKPSKLNAMQWKQVRTPEFKAWFGDWENDPANASKVVDENGEPLVVYHGTFSDFTQFKNEKLGINTQAASAGKGHFFTDSFITASSPYYATPTSELADNYLTYQLRGAILPDNILTSLLKERLGSFSKEGGIEKDFKANISGFVKKAQDMIDSELEAGGMSREEFNHYLEDYQFTEPSILAFRLAGEGFDWVNGHYGVERFLSIYNLLIKAIQTQSNLLEEDGTLDFAKKIAGLAKPLVKDSLAIAEWEWQQDAIKKFEGKSFGDDYADARFNENEAAPVIYTLFLNIRNPKEHDYNNSDYREITFNDLLKEAKEEGKDGAIFKNVDDGGDVFSNIFIAFNDVQIKSATGNTGQFSPTNPDIRYSRSDHLLDDEALPSDADIQAAQSLVQGWADKLGIAPPDVTIDQALNAQASYRYGTIRLSAAVSSYLGSSHPEVRTYGVEVLAHEFGHHIAETALQDAPPKVRSAIIKDYNRWTSNQQGRTVGQTMASRMTEMRGQVERGMTNEQLAKAGITPEYALSLPEWLADNAARVLLGQKTNGARAPETVGFIRKLVELFKKLWRAITGSYDTDLVSPSIEQFMQGLIDRHEGNYPGMPDGSGNALSRGDASSAVSDMAYQDAYYRGDTEAAQRMVVDAAKQAGVPVINEEAVTAYRVRRTAPPQKTAKAYKLFRVKKKQQGEVFALFVGANDPLPKGVWLDAIPGPQAGPSKTGAQKVKSKLGPLAYRPGWHSGDIPLATHIGAEDGAGNVFARKDDEVWAEVEMADDDPKWAELAKKNGTSQSGKFVAAKADVKEMPVNGMYRYKTNPNMTGQWIISGSMKINRILSEEEVNEILRRHDTQIMPWAIKKNESSPWEVTRLDLAKWGLETNPARNQKKLLDPFTFDDNGNLIPLSQRFNMDSEDPRYSLSRGELLAPNGKPSKLNAMQWKQVRTPEFKAWFGDWENDPANASKVVDENGEPLVVYHGSPYDFETFSKEKLGLSTEAKSATQGFFFASNPETAANYAKQDPTSYGQVLLNPFKQYKTVEGAKLTSLNVLRDEFDKNQRKYVEGKIGKANAKKWLYSDYPVSKKALAIIEKHKSDYKAIHKNEWDNVSDESINNVYRDFKQAFAPKIIPVFLNVRDPLTKNYEGKHDRDIDYYSLTLKAKKEERDGLVLLNTSDTGFAFILTHVYVAFDSKQIKSAIGNTGEFSPENPGIHYSLGSGLQSSIANQIANFKEPTVSTFGRLHKSVHTQFEKALHSPEYKRAFDSSLAFELDLARIANESADLAPLILPKLTPMDVMNGTINPVGAGKRAYRVAKDMKVISTAVFETTLAKKPYTDQELSAFTPQQQSMYRQFFATVNYSLDELAKSEMYRQARVLKLTPAPEDYNPTQAANFYYDQVTAEVRMQIAEVTRLWAEKQREIKALSQSAKNLPAISKFIRDEAKERARIAAKERNDAIKPLLNELRRFKDERKAFINKAANIEKMKRQGYAPLMRFGRFTVDAVDNTPDPLTGDPKGERIFFGMFDSEGEAKTVARALREEYPQAEVSRGEMSQEDWQMFRGITPETMEVFARAMNVAQDKAFQQYLKLGIANRSALKRLIHRKEIAGFSEDLPRVLASFVTSNARMAAKNYHLGEMIDAITSIDKNHGDVKDEAVKLYNYVQNPQEGGAAIRSALFAWYMGGSVASAAVNLTQTATTTLPYLSSYGVGKASNAIAKACKQALTEGSLPPDVRGALRRADEEGVTAPHELNNLYGTAMNAGWWNASKKLRPLGVAWGAFFSAAESYNRRVAFLAAYQLAKDAGEANPYQKACEAVNSTQFIYSKTNRPNWARGPIGQAVFTFKMFTISYVEFLLRLPNKQRAVALVVLLLLAGAGGFPFADDLDDLIDTIGQSLGYNTNAKEWKHRALGKLLGETGRDVALYGITSLTPFDLSARLGVSNIIPGTGLLKKSETDKLRDFMEFAGPTGSMAKRAVDAFDAASGRFTVGGKLMAASEAGLPIAVTNAIQGIDMLYSGQYKNMKGDVIGGVTPTESIGKVLGFQPASIAEIRRVDRISNQVKAMALAVKSDIMELWARGIVEDDEDKVAEAKSMRDDWNQKNPDWVIKIKMTSLHNKVKDMRQSSAQRIKKATPKAWRKKVMEIENE